MLSEMPEWMGELHSWARSLPKPEPILIGSGYMTHGLPFLARAHPDAVPGWSADFDAWADDAIAHADVDEPVATTIDGYGIGLSRRSFQVA